MKTTLDRTVDFDSEDFDHLSSAAFGETGVSLWDVTGESTSTHAITLDWDEWDALAAQVALYRKLKSQSEVA